MMATKRLLDVCDFQGGTQPPKDEWINDPREGYVRMLQIRDYSQGDAKYIQYVKDTKKLHKCTKDDIMLSRYGYIGQAFIGLEGAYNVALVKVIKKAEIHTPYLLCYFQSYYFQHFLLSNVGARATIPGFNKDELEKALIRIPEMCKQIEIASKITKVDELIGFHKQQLNVLDTLIKSRFIEMFGDPKRNPRKWDMVTIGDIATDVRYGTSRPATEGGKYPYLRMNNLTYEGYLDLTDLKHIDIPDNEVEKCVVRNGDVLFNRTNSVELVGKTCVYNLDSDMIIAGYIIRVRIDDRVLPVILSSYLNSTVMKEQLRSMAKGAVNQANINAQELRSIPIYLPPITLQHEFATFVEQVDKSKFYIVQMQILLRLLTRAIQQKTTEVLL